MRDTDIATVLGLTVLLIIIMLCFWPGFFRVRGATLAGYWRDEGGSLHRIVATAADGRSFTVTTQGVESTHVRSVSGSATRIRGVSIPADRKTGSLEIGGRRLFWNDGSEWVRQGVYARDRMSPARMT